MNTVAKKYDPQAIRRCVRLENVTQDGIVSFVTKSFTQPAPDDAHHVHIDAHTHEITCSCPDFRYRKARYCPTVASPDEHLCKHGIRAIANLRRKGFDL